MGEKRFFIGFLVAQQRVMQFLIPAHRRDEWTKWLTASSGDPLKVPKFAVPLDDHTITFTNPLTV